MSHTVHPYSHRLGIIREWKGRWFGMNQSYRSALKTDILVREFLQEELRSFYVGGVEIERSQKALRIIVKTSRPGMLMANVNRGWFGSPYLDNGVAVSLTWGFDDSPAASRSPFR